MLADINFDINFSRIKFLLDRSDSVSLDEWWQAIETPVPEADESVEKSIKSLVANGLIIENLLACR